MNKLIHYILIGIMLNWNMAVFAEDSGEGCEWKVIEETETYIQENCVGGEDGSFQARIRSKDIPGLEIIEVPAKDRKMAEKKIGCLAVMENNSLVGVINQKDLVKLGI